MNGLSVHRVSLGSSAGTVKALDGRFDEIVQLTTTVTAFVHIDCSCMSVMKMVLNCTGTFKRQYGVSFDRDRIRDIVDDMMPSRYLPMQSRSSHVRYMRFCRLIENHPNVMSLLESLNEDERTENIWA